LDLVTRWVGYGTIFMDYDYMVTWYLGGLLVVLAGFVELWIEGGNRSWAASKLVLLVGAAITVVISLWLILVRPPILTSWYIGIIGIALAAVLLLAIFELGIPAKWWIIAIMAIPILMIMNTTAGLVCLVGLLLFAQDL
jgi:hypothetical protein